MNKVIDLLTWLSFLITLIISIFTMVVVFGIHYIPLFQNFYPIEVSLSINLFLWGLDNLLNKYTKNTKLVFIISTLGGLLLLVFMVFGVY